jgi:surface polysaccharide O-acyltransferase-like enzyme
VSRPTRVDYIDNLRWSAILLVVAVHAGVTYSGLGSWYHVEKRPLGQLSFLFLAIFQSHAQAFFMGLLFFLAGCFLPPSYDRKGAKHFLLGRCKRLGLPALLYMAVVHPVTGYYLLHWWQGGFWRGYFGYLTNGSFFRGSGPMWFAIALLIFSAAYCVIKPLLPHRTLTAPAAPTWRSVVSTGLVITVLAFLIRTVQPIGTNVLNMQLCNFAQYIVLFALGVMACRHEWVTKLPARMGHVCLWTALISSPIVWLTLFGSLHGDIASINGGWHWQSGAYALWESMFCVTFCTGLLVFYREHVAQRNALTKLLTDNSFGVYFFHPPVLIAITLAMTGLSWTPLAKFAVASLLAIVATYASVHLILRRIPLLRQIL